ncbi:GNAT family N-acetyltransferase [Paenibacillus mendelii]|uniref:GNAT family N-acetyltransferase n=1 Tax=Paenibacillus mendelii TaxID=206163 RepID=A0ABV6J6G9_9BACL|nr:GNAT family N-acetyltransferase [Paenibacillus mendelii]MCQ6561242.1 GNAT family N-acetyltransferase [Paenibacillus mendelii]
MGELKFVKNYKGDEQLRKSLSELASNIFGISFERWYQFGFWSDRYIPYSYVDEGMVVANASVNKLELLIHGERRRAMQLGTVMTHPDYRNRGLSTRLMNQILEEYELQYDYMYLFANQSVLNFYPKFGFSSVQEYQSSMDFTSSSLETAGIRKLDGNSIEDAHFIHTFASERVPVSRVFGTDHSQEILMFYCMNVFSQDIYYLEREDVIAIFKKTGNQVDLFDVISKREINIEDILSLIAGNDTNRIVFHYTPDYKGIPIQSHILKGSEVLFVKTHGYNHLPDRFMHPTVSQA